VNIEEARIFSIEEKKIEIINLVKMGYDKKGIDVQEFIRKGDNIFNKVEIKD
jgi:hypothetical protein